MSTYSPTPASEVAAGDKVRPLAAVGPSVPKLGAEDYPWTVSDVQRGRAGRVRIWGHRYNARVSIESPALYGTFEATDTIEVLQ